MSRSLRPTKAEDFVRRTVFCEFPMTPAQAEFLATGRVMIDDAGHDDEPPGILWMPPVLVPTLTACGAPEPRPAGADFMRASYRRRRA